MCSNVCPSMAWYCGQTNTPTVCIHNHMEWFCGPTTPMCVMLWSNPHTCPSNPRPYFTPPLVSSLVTNECLYKAAASSAICRLPLNYVVELHYCTFALSLHGSAATSKPPPTQCVRQSLPLKRGFLGWDTSQVWNQTPLRCPFQEKRVVQELFSLSKSSNMASRSKSFCGPDDCCHLLISTGKRKTAKNVNLKWFADISAAALWCIRQHLMH